MEIKELQEWTKNIDKKRGVEINRDLAFPITTHMSSELGEVAECILRLEKWKDKPETLDHLGEELVDILILINKLANIYDIDIEQHVPVVQDKLMKKWQIENHKY